MVNRQVLLLRLRFLPLAQSRQRRPTRQNNGRAGCSIPAGAPQQQQPGNAAGWYQFAGWSGRRRSSLPDAACRCPCTRVQPLTDC